MSLRFQSLQSEVFEDRTLPSSVMLSISTPYQSTSMVRTNESTMVIRSAGPQYSAVFVNQLGYGFIPLIRMDDGRTLFMVVRASPEQPRSDGVTLPPLSERLSSAATRQPSTTEANDAVHESTRAATRTNTNTNPRTNLLALTPETRATFNDRVERRAESDAPTRNEQQTPPQPTNSASNQPVLRDYSNIEPADVTEVVVPHDPVLPTMPSEPVVPPTETEPEPSTLGVEELSTLGPLAGILPFNVTALEAETKAFLQQVTRMGSELAEEIADSSEYWWLAAAALSAGGAILATQPVRVSRKIPTSGSWFIGEDTSDNQRR